MKYVVTAITNPFGESASNIKCDNPEAAILEWCKQNEIYRTCVSINPATEDDGRALLKWAVANSDKLEAYMKQYHNPYKFEWLIDQVRTQVINNKVSMQWEYDQLFPFCMG